jgi:hypothetical protein
LHAQLGLFWWLFFWRVLCSPERYLYRLVLVKCNCCLVPCWVKYVAHSFCSHAPATLTFWHSSHRWSTFHFPFVLSLVLHTWFQFPNYMLMI